MSHCPSHSCDCFAKEMFGQTERYSARVTHSKVLAYVIAVLPQISNNPFVQTAGLIRSYFSYRAVCVYTISLSLNSRIPCLWFCLGTNVTYVCRLSTHVRFIQHDSSKSAPTARVTFHSIIVTNITRPKQRVQASAELPYSVSDIFPSTSSSNRT
jgi:hypothetical protein